MPWNRDAVAPMFIDHDSTFVPWGLHCPGLCLYGPKHQGADFLHLLDSQKTCNICNLHIHQHKCCRYEQDELAISQRLSPWQPWHLSFQGSHSAIEAFFLTDDLMADWQVDTASTNLALRVAGAGISKTTNPEAGVVPSTGHIGIYCILLILLYPNFHYNWVELSLTCGNSCDYCVTMIELWYKDATTVALWTEMSHRERESKVIENTDAWTGTTNVDETLGVEGHFVPLGCSQHCDALIIISCWWTKAFSLRNQWWQVCCSCLTASSISARFRSSEGATHNGANYCDFGGQSDHFGHEEPRHCWMHLVIFDCFLYAVLVSCGT